MTDILLWPPVLIAKPHKESQNSETGTLYTVSPSSVSILMSGTIIAIPRHSKDQQNYWLHNHHVNAACLSRVNGWIAIRLMFVAEYFPHFGGTIVMSPSALCYKNKFKVLYYKLMAIIMNDVWPINILRWSNLSVVCACVMRRSDFSVME